MSADLLIPPRTRVDELMDAPGIAPDLHGRALAGLARINRLSRVSSVLLRHVLDLACDLGRAELELLDVACGGADVPLQLARQAADTGVRLNLTLLDQSAGALDHAAQRAQELGIPCTFVRASALGPLPPANIVTNSLFLHHLDQGDVIAVLRNMAGAAQHLLLISDLRRSRLGLLAAWLGCRVLSRSPIVRFDGPASVRGAWTMSELEGMAQSAGLSGAEIRGVWPWRMLLSWRKPGAA